MANHNEVQETLRNIADPETAEHSQRFFKTGPGEYGEGDQFLGIRVPEIRSVARQYKQIPLDETERLIQSDFHEERLCALIILVNKSKKAGPEERKKLFNLYLDNTSYVNNWDLVDTSAEHIIGHHLAEDDSDRTVLYRLAISDNLWERRIAIMSTFHFIKNNEFEDTIGIAGILLNDEHDLIHKAVGWMLREVGKRDRETEENFLERHVHEMPRTMLRYAIEKFPDDKRRYYLKR